MENLKTQNRCKQLVTRDYVLGSAGECWDMKFSAAMFGGCWEIESGRCVCGCDTQNLCLLTRFNLGAILFIQQSACSECLTFISR